MKRFSKWLKSKSSRYSEVPGRVENHEPRKIVLNPNKYGTDNAANALRKRFRGRARASGKERPPELPGSTGLRVGSLVLRDVDLSLGR